MVSNTEILRTCFWVWRGYPHEWPVRVWLLFEFGVFWGWHVLPEWWRTVLISSGRRKP